MRILMRSVVICFILDRLLIILASERKEGSAQPLLHLLNETPVTVPLCLSDASHLIYKSYPSENENYNNSEVTDLFCKTAESEIIIDENKFRILENGYLYFQNKMFNRSQYCLHYAVKQNRIFWKAKICAQEVEIPRCCYTEPYLKSKCMKHNKNLSQPVNLMNSTLTVVYKEVFQSPLNCSNITVIEVDSEQLLIDYHDKLILLLKDSNKTITFNDFCIEEDATDTSYFISYCDSDFNNESSQCSEEFCIRKCCPDLQIYSYSQSSCQASATEYLWTPTYYDSPDFNVSVTPQHEVGLFHGFPLCKRYFPLRPSFNPTQKFFLMVDGTMYVEAYDKFYDNDQYCIDHFETGKDIREEALLCFPKKNDSDSARCERLHLDIYPSLMVVSCIFISLTLFVYSVLPDLYSKINGKCVIASNATLFFAYICFIFIDWTSGKISMTSCQVLGLFTQFFSLSSFFWLNVMCYDVWRALRSQHSVAGTSRTSASRRFIKYSIYAWGCPFIICLVTSCMQFIKATGTSGGPVTPGFGVTNCYFPANDPKPSWAYFYGFILVLMVVNTFFFIHLLILLQRERLKNDSVLKRRNRQHVMWMKLYLKLFGVMGITWIFEIASWIEGSCKLWIWTDVINSLRGLLIFGIFVCKRTIFEKLKNRSSLSVRRLKISLLGSSTYNSEVSGQKNSVFHVEVSDCGAV